MDEILKVQEFDIIIYILKIYFISIFTYYLALKSIDRKISVIDSLAIIMLFFIAIICGAIKNYSNSFNSIILLDILITIVFSLTTQNRIANSIIFVTISISINYIIFFIATALMFFPNVVFKMENDYINLIYIVAVYGTIITIFSRIKKLKNGFSFFQKNAKNEYFELLTLNISAVILFAVIILSNYNQIPTRNLGTGFIVMCGIMFMTIYKCFNVYYKQKLLVKELNETKEELEKKKQEIEQLEKENLNFSKTSHSIAHRQKALEYKLNELAMRNEIASEIDIEDRINKLSKEIKNKTTEVQLSKTDIPEIDDMLKYMQSECVKNKIDFQLQLNGNIHYMINNYISKENLEILLADHIKNAIIAINYSDNIDKSILVRLGNIDGVYSIYVYDSGIEFEIDTLSNLGKKPSTTHADNGGTGMGFMNTFDTLNKYKASLTIEEFNKPCKENFTKSIVIKFDKKKEFKISSYRYEKIQEQSNLENIIIEEISF